MADNFNLCDQPVRDSWLNPLTGASPSLTAANIRWFPQTSGDNLSTAATLGNGTLRLVPAYVPEAVTISHIGAEVTSAGDAGSTLVAAVYDNIPGSFYPRSLVAQAAILGDSGTVQEIDITDALIVPGWYWVGGVVQGVTVTQPTVRTVGTALVSGLISTSAPTAGQVFRGYSQGSVTGALPATFTTTLGVTTTAPRIHFRRAS